MGNNKKRTSTNKNIANLYNNKKKRTYTKKLYCELLQQQKTILRTSTEQKNYIANFYQTKKTKKNYIANFSPPQTKKKNYIANFYQKNILRTCKNNQKKRTSTNKIY